MIEPKCDFCKIELTKFGGIFFDVPQDNNCKKFHVCADCCVYLKDLMKIGIKQNKGYAIP